MQGGNTGASSGPPSSGGPPPTGGSPPPSGPPPKVRRALDELDLFIRDLEDEILFRRSAYPQQNGEYTFPVPSVISHSNFGIAGSSNAGDSKTKGGNQANNQNSLNGA